MKLIRILSRLALLSLAAAAFTALTGIYGGSVRLPLPDARSQAVRQDRPSAPQVSQFPELIAGGVELALYAMAGRIVFRLRLSPGSRRERQPIVLDLHREHRTAKA